MLPEARDGAYLVDIVTAGRAIQELTAGVAVEAFVADKPRQWAVERQMTILGEAARQVSAGFKAAHPEVPWRGMIAFRNVLVHDYGQVRSDRVWFISTVGVTEMLRVVEPLVPPLGEV